MKRAFRIIAAILFVGLALALAIGITSLYDWGGRIETILLVFGDRVWVTLDASRPRFLFLLLIPAVFVAAALSLRVWRR